MPWQKKNSDSRRTFIDTLCELAAHDEKVCLLVPDVGFNYIETFQKKFPNRYWNLGTTEFSAFAEAAGMALEGMKPYIYSMINFVTLRPLEQIRNAVTQHKANVKILGVKGSEKYKFLGFSHNMIFKDEDVYHLSPYMQCYKPETNEDVCRVIQETYKNEKPCYIRL